MLPREIEQCIVKARRKTGRRVGPVYIQELVSNPSQIRDPLGYILSERHVGGQPG